MSTETTSFLSQLAKARARQETALMRRRAEQAWRMRWGSILACATARAVTTSLLSLGTSHGADGDTFLSGGLLVEFWWCLKRRGAQMCTFGVLGLSCASPGESGGAAGVSHDSPRAQTCTFEGPRVFKNTTKIQREDPQRGKKRTNFAAGQGKNSAKFWAVRRRAVPGRAVLGKGGPGGRAGPGCLLGGGVSGGSPVGLRWVSGTPTFNPLPLF